MYDLTSKIAIVSGAGSGMGITHVRALTRAGARVVGFDRDWASGDQLVADLSPRQYCSVTGDVTIKQDWHRIVAECEVVFGKPNVLVNNAGIVRSHRVESVSLIDYGRVIDTNQVGVMLGMQAVIPAMREIGGGSIINVASTAGLVGFVDNFSYVASKWAVRGMTRAAAVELVGSGVRVNVICPGETDTPLLRADPTAQPPEISRFKRWARPEEVSAAVVFLASDQSAFMSGSDIVVDGAFTAA